ncbi:MAG: biotin--[acetyl-CoA-carboxylase] ligase, partial [Zoogloea sp.]|nr:biotin--[acetyl-CoA-carboxylase] ligase [Zoogloea sp.]
RQPGGKGHAGGQALVAGLALARALEGLGVEGVQLKWPNDVHIHGRKLAGILIELMPARGRLVAAVIGIGVNIRLPADADIPHEGGVTDLAACLVELPARNMVLAAVLASLSEMLERFSEGGFGPLRAAWQQRNAHADLPVRLIGETETLYGTCRGVDEDGALLLETDAGMTRVLSGEVSLRPVQ